MADIFIVIKGHKSVILDLPVYPKRGKNEQKAKDNAAIAGPKSVEAISAPIRFFKIHGVIFCVLPIYNRK